VSDIVCMEMCNCYVGESLGCNVVAVVLLGFRAGCGRRMCLVEVGYL
jgi:hypothetical protein